MRTYQEAAKVMLRVLPDRERLGAAAAECFIDNARAAINNKGQCTVALAGGGTQVSFFRRLATTYEHSVAWERMHVFWSDERSVPPTDAASNYRLAYDNLLAHVAIPAANIHRVPTELPDPRSAYESDLRAFFALPAGAWPSFDVLMLGMGSNGHTASLFPHSQALREEHSLVVATLSPQGVRERISFTLPLINAAAHILVLVSGSEKRQMVEQALTTVPQPEEIPIQGVMPAARGELLWLLDTAAAAGLHGAPPLRTAGDQTTRPLG